MTEAKSHSDLKSRIKWPWVLLAVLIVIVVGFRLSLKTNWVHQLVKNQIESAANEQLNPKLEVGNLSGDLWNEIIIADLRLLDEDKTVGSIDTVRASYNVWSYFSSAFEVSSIVVSRPFSRVVQQDSVWNVSSWIKQSEATDADGEAFPVSIRTLKLRDGKIDARANILQEDSTFTIENVLVDGSIDYFGEDFSAVISAFSFDVSSQSLSDTVSVESEANVNAGSVSLQKLVVATGNSVLQTSGIVSLEDSLSDVKLETKPLSWKDITTFTGEAPIRQDVRAELNITGSSDDLTLGLDVNATGLEQLSLNVKLGYYESLVLKKIGAKAQLIDLPVFTGDSTQPVLKGFSLEAEGNVAFDDLEAGKLDGNLLLNQASYDEYVLNNTSAEISLSKGEAVTIINTENDQQRLKVTARSENIFVSEPDVTFKVTGENVDPGYWVKDKNYAGTINFTADFSGNGFYPQDKPWSYDVQLTNSTFQKQDFTSARLRGQFSQNGITNSSTIRLDKSTLNIEAEADQLTSVPNFTYAIATRGFDLSEFMGMEDFKSNISARIEGKGSGNSLENLQLNSSVQLDSSVVNGEYINRLSANIEVSDTVATVSNSALNSTIADGSFSARLHLTDLYRVSNNLNLDVEIKDLQALAPLVGIEKMLGDGTIKGELTPVDGDTLKFVGGINLSNVNYDDSFTATNVEGNIEASIAEDPEYKVDVNLSSPSFASVNLQDFNIQTRGKVLSQLVEGTFDLSFSSTQDGQINQQGSYALSADSSIVETNMLELVSSERTLSLEKPFELLVENETIRMDTLSMGSTDGASLKLAVPYADSLNQKVFLSGQNINLTVLQNILLSDSYFEGVMSGSLYLDRADTSLTAEGDLTISDIVYRETVLDKFQVRSSIKDGYLNSDLTVTDNNKEIINGRLEVPFTMKKPSTIDDAFFDKSIDGSLQINQVALNDFEKLLEGAGITDTEGVLSFDGRLGGRAGMPRLTGDLNLDQAVLSGVKVDSVTANLDYDHEQSEITLNAAVNTLKQKAADVTAKIPFYIDLLTFDLAMPEETEEISVDLETNNFNLASLNDFVDPEQIRDIQGRLDGMLKVTGSVGDLKTDGELTMSNASLRIVPAGIRLNEMKSSFVFEPNQISVPDFTAKSGSGSLNANGEMALNELVPGQMDITVSAKNFRAANTSQYNAIINANADINGTLTSPSISGSVQFLNGFVKLDNFGEKSVENVSLDSAEVIDESTAMYDSLSLDMDITFNRRFFVQNERYLEMEVELEGQVDLLKEKSKELQMFGAITTSSGYARPLGKDFMIEEGQITFSGNPENPSVNVRSLYEPPQPEEDIKIWYVIEGTVEDPRFKYESQPEMELQSIISYTLFGQPFYKLDSWQQVVANSGSNTTAADVAMEVLLDRVESLATRQLGIDVVKIDNTLSGGQNGTSITTGWYISPKIFFAIQNVITGSTPNTGFLLEYKLRQNLKLILSQGNDSRQGIDLKWNHDY